MRNTIILLVSVVLFSGCASKDSDEVLIRYDIGGDSEGKTTLQNEEILVEIEEPDGELVLGQALALTLVHHPELKVYSLEVRAAQARALQAGLWPNPEVEVEMEEVGGGGSRSGFSGAETTIMLSQLIELGNRSQKEQKVASLEKEIAGLNYEEKKLYLFSEAAKAFIEVLKAQEKLRLSGELLKVSQESFDAVEKRVRAGRDSNVELNRASVALANVKISHRRSQSDLVYARKRLGTFWGQQETTFKQAVGDLRATEPLPSLDGLKRKLLQAPEYARYEAEIRKREAVLELEKSKSLGDIHIGAGMQRFNETDDNAVVFGISVPFPISDRNQGSRQAAVYDLAKSIHEKKAARLWMYSELNEMYRQLENAYVQAESLREEVLPTAKEMYAAVKRAYEAGKVDYLNLLDSQRTLFDVKNELIDSLSVYHWARIDIERFIGSELGYFEISGSEY